MDISKTNKRKVVQWLQNVAKATVKSFLNKRVDVIITDREETTKKRSHVKLNKASQNRSALILGLASNAKPAFCGTSSVVQIANTWNIKILKYAELMSCMTENPCLPTRQQPTHVTEHKKGYVHHLRTAFVKVEDHSRKYRPEFVEMKYFSYLDLDTKGTTSPFDTWFRENCVIT